MTTLHIGTYTCPLTPEMQIDVVRTEWGWVESWTLNGILVGSSQSAIAAAEAALRAAIAAGSGVDWKLLADDGFTVLEMLDSSETAFGVEAKALGFPEGLRGQFATNRVFRIQAEAAFKTLTSDIIVWSESITVQDGGQDFILDPVLGSGRVPKKYLTAWQHPIIVQSGNAVGLAAYPDWPAAKYSLDWLRPRPTLTRGAPRRTSAGLLREYPINWAYTFWAPNSITFLNPEAPPL